MSDGVTSMEPARLAPGSASAGGVACPHCGHPNPLPRDHTAFIDCRHCDRSFAWRAPQAAGDANLEPLASGFQTTHARSPTDVGLRATGALAALLTAAFYLTVVRALAGSYVGDLFGARGWVPYVITWFSFWAFLLLGLKAWLLAAQRRALQIDWLPDALATRITPANAERFRRNLQDLAARALPRRAMPGAGGLGLGDARSFLVERIDRSLERLRMRGSAPDVIDQLASQSQLDANAVESSYTMVRVFIWAIPLLGFIGTVVGISAAVAGFSDSVAQAVDLDVMKQSIGTVTMGLGVAFDTTLLALVMSILIMFPTTSLQKAEEDFLSRVDAYCDERLGRRLDDGSGKPDPAPQLGALESQIARLARTLEALDTKLSASSDRGPGRGE